METINKTFKDGSMLHVNTVLVQYYAPSRQLGFAFPTYMLTAVENKKLITLYAGTTRFTLFTSVHSMTATPLLQELLAWVVWAATARATQAQSVPNV